MILIYTEKAGPRVVYTFDTLFRDILGIEYKLCCNKAEFTASKSFKLNYSSHPIGNEPFIEARKLLFQSDIHPVEVEVDHYTTAPIFFKTSKQSLLPFDPFAASFYLISRYEEYLPYTADRYNRFEAEQSLAYKHNFLELPVVNIWTDMLASELKAHYPDLKIPDKEFTYISTIDIDNAWAYLNKGVLRTLGATARSAVKLDTKDSAERLKVLLRKKEDPFDTFTYLRNLHKDKQTAIIYFLLLGKYGKYDKNISPENKEYQQLINEISQYWPVGIHPSFNSSENHTILQAEIASLDKITGKKTTKSRQHFIKLAFPTTYRNLIKYNILEDYTMGYASASGFRAGICSPYFFYDLARETTGNLKIFPFQVMDQTLNGYLGYSPDEALNTIRKIMREVKKVNGTFISLWHNESLSDTGRWAGWRKVYEEMLNMPAAGQV